MFMTHIILNAEGEVMASYHKTHLFDVELGGNDTLKESNHMKPGSTITPPVHTPVGKVGLAVVSFTLRVEAVREGERARKREEKELREWVE